MKGFMKVSLIITLICVVLGLGLFIGGLALGGSVVELGEAFNRGDFTIGGRWNYSRQDYSFDTSENTVDDNKDTHHSTVNGGEYNNIEKLKVDIGAGTFTMEASDDDKVRVEITGRHTNKISVKQDGNELKIDGDSHFSEGEVILYCPTEMKFQEIDISIGGGEGVINVPASAEKFDVNIGAGSFNSEEHIQAAKSSWEVDAGEIALSSLEGDDMDFECSMGSIEVTVAGSQEEYDYELECSVGSLRIGDEEYSGLSEREISGGSNSGKRIEAKCSVGEIVMDFNK